MKNYNKTIYTLADVAEYINSEAFDAIELEKVLEENDWIPGSTDKNFGSDGYEKLVMQENGKVELVRLSPDNIDRSDIQAYIRKEINQGNSVCVDEEGIGAGDASVIDSTNGEWLISDLNEFSEPVEVSISEVTDSFRDFIKEWMGESEDNHIYKMTRDGFTVFITLHIY